MIEQVITIAGDGPGGAAVLTLDKNGIYHNTGARFFTDYDSVEIPLLASTVDGGIWAVHSGIWQVMSVIEYHTVVGGSGANVTVVVCPGGVAIASGVAQLTAEIDLTVTAPVRQFGTLITTPTRIQPGDVVGINMSGTLTNLVGMLSVAFKRVG